MAKNKTSAASGLDQPVPARGRVIQYDTPLLGSLTASQLLRRWAGTTSWELHTLICERKLPAYLCKGQGHLKVNADGQEYYMCAKNGSPCVTKETAPDLCWDNVRFDYSDVVLFECEHPEYLDGVAQPFHDTFNGRQRVMYPDGQTPQMVTLRELYARWPGAPANEIRRLLDIFRLTLLFPSVEETDEAPDDDTYLDVAHVLLSEVESIEAYEPGFMVPVAPLVTIETIEDLTGQAPSVVQAASRKAQTKPKGTKKKYAISAAKAAERCGVEPRTINNWDKGKSAPGGYPGRTELTAFIMFAEGFKLTRGLKTNAVAMNRAKSYDPQYLGAKERGNAFDED